MRVKVRASAGASLSHRPPLRTGGAYLAGGERGLDACGHERLARAAAHDRNAHLLCLDWD